MSRTIVAILSHSLANDTARRHWQYYRKAGCPILGVGRTDTDCWFPPPGHNGCLGSINIGKESYAKGDNHLTRFLDLLRHFETMPAEFTDICVVEYDGIFLKPLPPHPGGLCTTLAGYNDPDFHGTRYFHSPWRLDRETARQVIEWGERMLKANLFELGFLDRFLGLMADLYPLRITPAHAFSVNTLDTPEHIQNARKAIEQGVYYVHGCKTESQLKAITENLANHTITVLSETISRVTSPDRARSFCMAADEIRESKTRNIIETGCYRGTPTDGMSTIVLALIAKDLGFKLHSYELEQSNIDLCRGVLKERGLLEYVEFHQGDSLANLSRRTEPIGFAYLDSFDCGLGSHRASQEHQLAELECILPLLEKRSTVLLDDHVESKGGKTKLSMRRLDHLGFSLASSGLQLLYVSNGSETQAKRYRFAVLCCHSQEYVPLAIHTAYQNKGVYCVEHGYDLKVERTIRDRFADAKSHANGFSWSRLETMLDLVSSGQYEWVWCVGVDTLITNMAISLESVVSGVPAEKHVIICGEHVAPIQADSFLVRGSDQGAAWLRDIIGSYERYKHHGWVENQAMIDSGDRWAHLIHFMPQHRLNSYQYNLYYTPGNDPAKYASGTDCYGNRGEWKPGDFVIHWPGMSLEKRMNLLAEYRPRIMKSNVRVTLIYTRVVGRASDGAPPPENYAPATKRFFETYQQFKPSLDHELVIVNCNGDKPDRMFDDMAKGYLNYGGNGWDCGVWQFASHGVSCDLMVCFNSWAYFWRKDWLEPIVDAYQRFGPGVYGPTSSYERWPHIRTPCIAFSPQIAKEYPHATDNRTQCCDFESGPDNFTVWANRKGYPTMLVVNDGVFPMEKWRDPSLKNIFRRGTQENCLVFDRHTQLYANASPDEKRSMEMRADTLVKR